MSQPTRKSAAQPQPLERKAARKGSATPPRPAPSLYAVEQHESDGTESETPKPQRPRVEGYAARGPAKVYPISPSPPRPGNGRLYWINVREHWDPETFEQYFRLHNHDALAGGRLYKGTAGPGKKIIPWPFEPGFEWLVHTTREAADTAAAALQGYLDKIEAK